MSILVPHTHALLERQLVVTARFLAAIMWSHPGSHIWGPVAGLEICHFASTAWCPLDLLWQRLLCMTFCISFRFLQYFVSFQVLALVLALVNRMLQGAGFVWHAVNECFGPWLACCFSCHRGSLWRWLQACCWLAYVAVSFAR